jgi:hypothetical protein
MKLIFTLLIIFFNTGISYSQTADSFCGGVYYDAYKDCKEVSYQSLPKGIKQLMKKSNCNVKTGSNYDYGFAIDLNDDDNMEYIFCCNESVHGPCLAYIYSKINNEWRIILATNGFLNDCDKVLVVLVSMNEGFHDLCIFDNIVKFSNGRYR